MKSAFLTKAALCICPPAVVATTVATVPPVRKAVHRYTAAYEPKAPHKPSAAPCVPVARTTFGYRLPDYDLPPIDTADYPPGAYVVVPPEVGTNVPVVPPIGPGVLPPPGGGSDVPGVPEPSVWMTMVVGFGLIGAGYRQRRRYTMRSRKLALAAGIEPQAVSIRGLGFGLGAVTAASGTMLGGGLSPATAGTKLAQLGSKALHSSMLAKAAMCVCPPVAMAVTAAAVPPVRHAVYNATKPSTPVTGPKTIAHAPQGVPCVPVVVPTAAEAVKAQGDSIAVLSPSGTFPS